MTSFTNFTPQVLNLLYVFFIALICSTIIFGVSHHFKKNSFTLNLVQRTNSWWIIYLFYILTFGFNFVASLVGLAFISFIAHREFLSNLKFSVASRRIILWSYFAIPLQYYFIYRGNFLLFEIFIPVFTLFLLLIRAILQDDATDYIKNSTQLHLSLMISTYTISHIAYLYQLPTIESEISNYQALIFFLIFITSVNDIFQFIAGKIFKGPKLIPKLSPNKTITGALGGILGSILLGHLFSPIMPLSHTQSLISAGFISVFGLLGDLNISAIKRNLVIKDMSNFIPGHGGIMDRLDSLSFTSIIFFYLIYYWVYA